MESSGVGKQFTKLQTLTTVLPKEVIEEIKPILRKKEADFENNDAYLMAKEEIIRIFGPPDEAPFERAMGRVLSGKPSQLARGLVNDLCDNKEMKNCCCKNFIAGLWKKHLPSNVRAAIADDGFDHNSFRQC